MKHFEKTSIFLFRAKEGDCITFSNILFMTHGDRRLEMLRLQQHGESACRSLLDLTAASFVLKFARRMRILMWHKHAGILKRRTWNCERDAMLRASRALVICCAVHASFQTCTPPPPPSSRKAARTPESAATAPRTSAQSDLQRCHMAPGRHGNWPAGARRAAGRGVPRARRLI